ncbi:endolytic transglycosylase MltG [Nonomuraea sp. WAC 01424]|uniref:endolytic transglycosylase MltG n=1 Tax=Nonomuraea sp. WAC 01424 TaxID=2203200 RepID=UPI0026C8B49E|nr:endolytic transglycosylase MltG [Nonomuraea sp. WAC 01424]
MTGTPDDDAGEVIPFRQADSDQEPPPPEPGHPEPGHPDSGHPEPGHPDSGHPEPAHSEPGRPETGRREQAAGEPGDHGEPAEVIPLSPRRGRALRRAGLISAALVAALVAAGAGMLMVVRPYLSPDDFEGTGSGTVTVRIPPGANAEQIGTALADAGVVASSRSFVNAAQERAVANRLRPGHYRLRKGMAAGAALALLLAPASRLVRRVVVPEGLRAGEVLRRVAQLAGLPLKELQGVDKSLIGLPSYAPGIEGFLFPATYEVEPGDKPVDLLAAMVERWGVAARQVRLAEGAARLGLSPLEAVTVASLVQAEGGTDADYPKIARVIYNRLGSDRPLELDTTVLYAQNRRSLKVTERDTKVNSPYNTYHRHGLPPGPIANPGEKALLAALHPAQGDWHWFVTTDPAHRITKFTNKESEFVRYREELNKNLGTG